MTRSEIARARDAAKAKAQAYEPGLVAEAWWREYRRLAKLYNSLPMEVRFHTRNP
jgi:hypothetical protein